MSRMSLIDFLTIPAAITFQPAGQGRVGQHPSQDTLRAGHYLLCPILFIRALSRLPPDILFKFSRQDSNSVIPTMPAAMLDTGIESPVKYC